MVYSSPFSSPLFFQPTYGAVSGPFPNANPNLYPNFFFPPGPAVGGGMYPNRPFSGFFPPGYPISTHHPVERQDWGKDFKNYMSGFKFW